MKTPLTEGIANLKSDLKGKLILPNEPGYDEARRMVNQFSIRILNKIGLEYDKRH